MTALSENIKQLNNALQQLLKQYQILFTQNEQNKKTITSLTETAKLQTNALDKLRQEHLLLKASLDKMDENEKKEVEQKINAYIRNIDKCISLLSHNAKV